MELVWSGVCREERTKSWEALIIKEKIMKNVSEEKFINEAVLTMNLTIKRDEEYAISTKDEKKEVKEKFFQDLQMELDNNNNKKKLHYTLLHRQ
ncbi:hypothetical protein ILUMI_06920 [Ignelater luminosus]|uniref:Uncharacterized protein n=1 Tax=Ignelater luminosus TaxID=2038154 RepID=A0A8K0DA78_IGNLU|nr:hypothetical protein ILUMI_06920 [Ignelater luminosus]